jgi:hypothetical protein
MTAIRTTLITKVPENEQRNKSSTVDRARIDRTECRLPRLQRMAALVKTNGHRPSIYDMRTADRQYAAVMRDLEAYIADLNDRGLLAANVSPSVAAFAVIDEFRRLGVQPVIIEGIAAMTIVALGRSGWTRPTEHNGVST